jgi:hypothetical protein
MQTLQDARIAEPNRLAVYRRPAMTIQIVPGQEHALEGKSGSADLL